MMPLTAPDPTTRAAEFWDKQPPAPQLSRWWMWPRIIAFQNERICGKPLPTWNAGLITELRRRFPGRCFGRGISIGCGAGGKELLLLKEGLVQDIDLFEISTTRIEQGRKVFEAHGLSDRVHWHKGDGLETLESGPCYDLVFWDNALHHMPDTPRAVRASLNSLKPNGAFVMNDFVGATRFQWSDRQLRFASQVRESLSAHLLRHPENPRVQLPRLLQRPSVEAMIAGDPSEAADSERILPAIRELLPEPRIWLLGGAIYHLALSDILANLDEARDKDLLDALLVLDSALIEMGETHYAACISVLTCRAGPSARDERARLAEPNISRKGPTRGAMSTKTCNICGATEFTFGPGRRLSDTGELPQCSNCGSLERHRTLHDMYARMKAALPLHDYDALQIGDDQALPHAWFKSIATSVPGGENSIDIQSISLPSEQYDLVACNHVLEYVRDDRRALEELLRIVRYSGLLQLGVADPLRHAVTDDRSFAKDKDGGPLRNYGTNILDVMREALAVCFLLATRLVDPVTHMEHIYFLCTRSRETIDRMLVAFPGASVEFLRGDGKQFLVNQYPAPLRAFERIALDSGKFRSSRSFRDYVVSGGHTSVPGWVAEGALTTISGLASLQDELGIDGPACEIGVHHGRLFIALASMAAADAVCLAIDVFENQEANVDKSGHGDHARFMANVERWLGDTSRVRVLKADSLTLEPENLSAQLDGKRVRLFSVDGGHTVKHVLNDLALAEGVLAPGGVVIVDDFYNPHWPGVMEGVVRYLHSDRPGVLVPFAYGDNKLYLTREDHAAVFHAYVGQGLRPFAVDYKAVELAGRPVHQIRMPPVADLQAEVASEPTPEPRSQMLGDVEVVEFIGPWHASEKAGRWTGGNRSGVVLEVAATRPRRKLTGRIGGIVTPDHPETNLELYVNGSRLAAASYRSSARPVELDAELDAFEAATELRIEFVTDYAARPKDIGLSADSRTLGVLVMALRIL